MWQQWIYVVFKGFHLFVKELFYIVDVDVAKGVLSNTVSNYKIDVKLFVY